MLDKVSLLFYTFEVFLMVVATLFWITSREHCEAKRTIKTTMAQTMAQTRTTSIPCVHYKKLLASCWYYTMLRPLMDPKVCYSSGRQGILRCFFFFVVVVVVFGNIVQRMIDPSSLRSEQLRPTAHNNRNELCILTKEEFLRAFLL